MSKFTFICEDEHIPFADDTITNKRTFEFSGVLLHEIVAEFEMFLKGCGFSFEGQLDFVNDTGDSKIDEDDDFDPFTTKINVLPESFTGFTGELGAKGVPVKYNFTCEALKSSHYYDKDRNK
jgi:hypothetical protein